MTCCQSATNTYRKIAQPIINTTKGLRKHKRRNIPKFHTLIGVCCSADSKFGSPDLMPPNVEVVRITSSNDFSTSLPAQGLRKAIKALRSVVGKRDRRHVTIWFSLPCTWGFLARVANSVKGRLGDHSGRSAQLWNELGSRLPNLYLLVHEVLLIRGDVIFE